MNGNAIPPVADLVAGAAIGAAVVLPCRQHACAVCAARAAAAGVAGVLRMVRPDVAIIFAAAAERIGAMESHAPGGCVETPK